MSRRFQTAEKTYRALSTLYQNQSRVQRHGQTMFLRYASVQKQPRTLLPMQGRWFASSTDEGQEAAPSNSTKQDATFSESEKEANRQEWGIKYDDECLKFEKEWQAIAEAVEKENMVYLEAELSTMQKKKVDMLVDKVLDMNVFEHRYFHAALTQRVQRVTGMNPMKLNLDWPSLKQDGAGTWPPANPNWFKQQELMSSLGPFMGQMGGAMGGGQAAPAGDEAAN